MGEMVLTITNTLFLSGPPERSFGSGGGGGGCLGCNGIYMVEENRAREAQGCRHHIDGKMSRCKKDGERKKEKENQMRGWI